MEVVLSYTKLLYIILSVQQAVSCKEFRTFQSGLCNPPHPVYNKSCQLQLPEDLRSRECMLFFEKNTKYCSSRGHNIKEVNQYNSQKRAKQILPKAVLHLNVYQFNNFYYTLLSFNITMIDITWNALNMTFIVGNERVCIDFYMPNVTHLSSRYWTLFYDCPWYSGAIEGKTVMLEYMTESNGYWELRRYGFQTPSTFKLDPCNTDLKSQETFTYLDLTFLPQITLYIQTLPSHFQVDKYEVKQCFCDSCTVFNNFDDCIHVGTVKATSGDEKLNLSLNIGDEAGSFFYAVFACLGTCTNGSYYISQTIILSNESFKALVIWWSSELLLLFLLVTALYFYWKWHTGKLLITGDIGLKRSTVLLVHNPLHSIHMNIVLCLANFLEQHCNMNILLDIRDIPLTEHKDPILWYSSAIMSANFVAVITSPECCDGIEAIYKDLYNVGLNFIKEIMYSKSPKTKIFTIQLPYCNESDIPVMAKCLMSFKLMEEFDSLISLVLGWRSNFCGKYCLNRKVFLSRIHNCFELHGNELIKLIAEMEKVVKHNDREFILKENSGHKRLNYQVEDTISDNLNSDLNCSGNLVYENSEQTFNDSVFYEEINISDIDLSGAEKSTEKLNKNSDCTYMTDEFCCDNLNL